MTLATLPDFLGTLYSERTAVHIADSALIEYPGFTARASVSYTEIAEAVARVAGGLKLLGVRRGDPVALMTLNRFEMFLVALAVARLGAIPVPLNYLMGADEVTAVIRRADVETFITDHAVFAGRLGNGRLVPSVKRWIPIERSVSGDSLLDAAHAAAPLAPVSARSSDPALVFFTSGTTGRPKGAVLSHASATVGVRSHGRAFALRPRMGKPLVLSVMPVAHVGGYAALLTYLAIGWPVLFYPQFDANRLLELIEEWQITAFTGTPTMFRMLLDAGAAKRDLSSIRLWGGGGDAFPDELVRQFRDLAARRGPLGVTRRPMFVRGYGMAEANGYVAQTPPMPVGDRCIGWVLPPVRYRIVDESGRDAKQGTPGELLLTGPTIASGYWNDDQETRAQFEQGWFRTGDIARRGRLGLLYFVDRSRDLITSGGYKIAAAEVDHVLEAHPSVAHAATVGVPHDRLGEEPMTVVVLRQGNDTTERDLLQWARSRLASTKCPTRVVFFDTIPLTSSLKPRRHEVQIMLTRRLEEGG